MKKSVKPNFFKKFSIACTLLLILGILLHIAYNKDGFEESLRTLSSEQLRKRICAGIDYTEIATKDERNSVKSDTNSAIDQWMGQNHLKKYLNKEIDDQEFVQQIGLRTAMPWIVLAILSILGWIGYFFCCICDGCACFDRCKRKVKYTNCEMCWPITGLLLFCALIIAVGAVGIFFSSQKIKESYKTIYCVSYSIVDDLNTGSTGWAGFNKLNQRIDDFMLTIDQFMQRVSTTFNQSPWAKNMAQQQAQFVIDSLDGSQANVAQYQYNAAQNPSTNSANPTDSIYFKNVWYPYTTTGKSTQVLHQLANVQGQAVATIVDNLSNVGKDISNQGISFKDALKKGQDSIKDIRSKVDDLSSKINDFMDSSQDQIDYFELALFIYFIVAVAYSVVVAISAIFIILCKLYCLRIFIHIGWFLFGIMMIAGFIACIVLSPTSAVLLQTCQVFDDYLNNENIFINGYARVDNLKQVSEKVKVCKRNFNQNGDILAQFNIRQQIDQVNQLSQNISQVLNISNLDDYKKLKDTSNIINGLQISLDNQKSNGLSDTIESEPAFIDLNKLTKQGTGMWQNQNCPSDLILDDTWLTQIQLCSGGEYTTPGDLPSPTTSPSLCINANKYTLTEITNQRYNLANLPGNCAQKGNWLTDVNTRVSKIVEFTKRKNAIVTSKSSQLQQYKDMEDVYLNKVDTFIGDVKSFSQNTNDMLIKVTDSKEGILSDINCLFVGDNFDKMYDSICVKFNPAVYTLMIIMILISCSMFCGAWFFYCTGIRFARQQNLLKQEEEKAMNENKYKDINVQ